MKYIALLITLLALAGCSTISVQSTDTLDKGLNGAKDSQISAAQRYHF